MNSSAPWATSICLVTFCVPAKVPSGAYRKKMMVFSSWFSFSNLKIYAGMNLFSPAMPGNALHQEDLNDISSPPILARLCMRELG